MPLRSHPISVLLLLLLAADAMFVGIHLVHEHSPYLNSELYSIKQDRSYSELFQYVKTYWIVLVLAALAWRARQHVYVAWALLFAYLLLDDVMQIHEGIGHRIAVRWGYEGALRIRAQDFGELTVSAVAGLFLFAPILFGWLRADRDARNASIGVALLFGVFAVFGVLVDLLETMSPAGSYLRSVLATLEDGGEMFAMSAICWYVVRLLENGGRPVTSLHELPHRAFTRSRRPAGPAGV